MKKCSTGAPFHQHTPGLGSIGIIIIINLITTATIFNFNIIVTFNIVNIICLFPWIFFVTICSFLQILDSSLDTFPIKLVKQYLILFFAVLIFSNVYKMCMVPCKISQSFIKSCILNSGFLHIFRSESSSRSRYCQVSHVRC